MAKWTGLVLLIFIRLGHGQEDPCLNNTCVSPSTCARSGNSPLCLCTGLAAGDLCEIRLFALETEVERFNSPSGTLLSPNFPDMAPDMLRFVYQIVQVPGAINITFTINFFCLEFLKDYLFYGAGNSPSLDVFPNEVGVPFLSGCPNDTDIPTEIIIEGDSAWFRLDTDLNIRSPGYNINYVIVNAAPVISCPSEVTEVSQPGNTGNTASWSLPTCTDAEQDPDTLQVTCTPASGSLFPVGINTATCTCIDNEAASATCDVTIIISTADPVITCPSNVSVVSLPGNGGNSASWPMPNCTDIDQDSTTLQVTCTPPSDSVFPVGTNTVTCSCTDDQGAVDTCDVIVNVSPSANSSPVIICPGEITVPTLPGNIGNSASWPLPTCTDVDQDSATLRVICDPPSGDTFPIGRNSVTCTCEDDQAASVSCFVIVNVLRGVGDSVCDGNPCFPNECRPVERNGRTLYNCHQFVGSECSMNP